MGTRRAAHGMQMAGCPDDEKNYNLFLLSKTKCRRAFLFHTPERPSPHPRPPPRRFFFYFPPFPGVFKGKSAGPGGGAGGAKHQPRRSGGKDPERSFNQLILFLVYVYAHTSRQKRTRKRAYTRIKRFTSTKFENSQAEEKKAGKNREREARA